MFIKVLKHLIGKLKGNVKVLWWKMTLGLNQAKRRTCDYFLVGGSNME